MNRSIRLSAAALITALTTTSGLLAPALAQGKSHHHRARAASSGGAGLGGPGGTATSGPTSTAVGTTVPAQAPVASTPSHPTVPGFTAAIVGGVAYAPAGAPLAVQRAIWAGDRIRLKPYIYGGGHGSFRAAGYDCSGSVSYVLHAAGLLAHPMDSSDLLGWGTDGIGQWITVYTNSGHAFVEIAGIRLDTSSEGDPGAGRGSGPRWRPLLTDTSAYTPRTFAGF